jgi:hypothetical protein
VAVNKPNLAIRFSVLEFISEDERQRSGAAKKYSRGLVGDIKVCMVGADTPKYLT